MERFEAESAGIEPGKLNPIVARSHARSGFGYFEQHLRLRRALSCLEAQEFDYVITVCDETSAERCPTFPGAVKRLHWGFPDPSTLQVAEEEKLERTREIRDLIRDRVEQWIPSVV